MNKVLGLDLGARTCGVALSDIMGMIASPVETYLVKESSGNTRTYVATHLGDGFTDEEGALTNQFYFFLCL